MRTRPNSSGAVLEDQCSAQGTRIEDDDGDAIHDVMRAYLPKSEERGLEFVIGRRPLECNYSRLGRTHYHEGALKRTHYQEEF